MQSISLTRPFIGKEEEGIDTLRSGLIATGPETERLERESATGNGDMLVTDDDNIAELVRSLRDHSLVTGAWEPVKE